MPDPIESDAPRRKKGIYLGAPACFALQLAMQPVVEAFCRGHQFATAFLVGSCLKGPNWRDVDVRLMMADELFAATFPDAGQYWENDPKWLLMTVAISNLLAKQTGLPIDFQFQPMTHANERFPTANGHPRNAIGIRIKE